ncbi:hypothetical protein KLP40_16985 [Hymenobacter sp. NST-14]|uniref:hypothetical protein n=1 Tax=Hymenobacter piscis TaxID=2839984 RepID=UPI001C026963|nr:hypothetical protein [Hymenobacter piscis]MBT9394863.1 hypothetical protein [Hymenobacter piscis]
MAKFDRPLRGGVLIQGSLLWQDEATDRPWEPVRQAWREQHLNLNFRIPVRVPIRYGRYSALSKIPVRIAARVQQVVMQSQDAPMPSYQLPFRHEITLQQGSVKPLRPDGTLLQSGCYTMVLSTDYDYNPANPAATSARLGKAVVYGLQQATTASAKELHREIKALARAEGLFTSDKEYFNKAWGAVTVLLSPALEPALRDQLTAVWKPSLRKAGFYERFRMGQERSCLRPDGTLAIQPLLSDPPDGKDIFATHQLDFVLATATLPMLRENTQDGYPSPEVVGHYAYTDLRRYFQRNHHHGIVTADDEAIKSFLLHGR